VKQNAVIVGAGIGGLVTAIGLAKQGWQVTVLERAATLEPVGAGIILADNAIRALHSLGLADALIPHARVAALGGLRRADGRWMLRVPPRAGDRTLTLHRAELISSLVAQLPPACLRLGTALESVEQMPRGMRAHLADGQALDADLLVGADGLRSRVRSQLFAQQASPKYAGFTAWRTVVAVPDIMRPPTEATESWGRGALFGIVPLTGRRVYLYATARQPAAELDSTPGVGAKTTLLGRFEGWHEPISALIGLAPDDGFLAHDIYCLASPLRHYHERRAVLLGDAAHAMTPNLGQGAGQAIEDAIRLCALLSEHPIEVALPRYSAERAPRANAVARNSARIGRIAHQQNPATVVARDAVLGLIGWLSSSGQPSASEPATPLTT
jgi:2-polyprenyl-6-methoxyphenol hydroxylase-like FAD-dependent oxidoreductase